MRNKLIILSAMLLSFCSCQKEKYRDEPFFKLEFSYKNERFYYEDMGKPQKSWFGIVVYKSMGNGPQFQFENVNDTLRRAKFEFNISFIEDPNKPSPGPGENHLIQFKLLSPDAFFYIGKKYPLFVSDINPPAKSSVRIARRIVGVEGNKLTWVPDGDSRCIGGSFSFRKPNENPMDRFVLCFDLVCVLEAQPNYPADTVRIKDGFLTVCRRLSENSWQRDLILYEK